MVFADAGRASSEPRGPRRLRKKILLLAVLPLLAALLLIALAVAAGWWSSRSPTWATTTGPCPGTRAR